MRREKRKTQKTKDLDDKRKYLSVIGFLTSVALLSIAIFLSIKQEQTDRIAALNDYTTSNVTLVASSEISKSINEVVSTKSETVNSNEKEISNEVDNSTIEVTNENEENVNNTNSQEKKEEIIQSENVSNEKENQNKQFIKPIDGDIYKEYSMDSLVYSDTLQEWVTHRGIDIQANVSDEVKACRDGTIKAIKQDPRYGLSVTIEHKDGFESVYTCLLEVKDINEGDTVEQGQIIAKAGNSGVFEVADGIHLHFEMLKDGEYINPEMYIK